jgi:hypothetical protein
MDLGRLKDVVRDAALLNIRFYASVVDMSRDLLQSLKVAIEDSGRTPSGPVRNVSPTGPATPPLILAARAGEHAEGAFVVVNNLQLPVTATIEVAGDIDRDKIRISPQGKMLAPGEQFAVHISVKIDETLEMGRDRHATIAIPGLASRSIPFIVRRLPDSAEPDAASTDAMEAAPATAQASSRAGRTNTRKSTKKSGKRMSS